MLKDLPSSVYFCSKILMKIYMLLSTISFLASKCNATNHVRLTRVVSNLDMEKLYLETLGANHTSERDQIADPETMNGLICKDISKSGFFSMLKEDPVDMNNIYEEIGVLYRIRSNDVEKSYYRTLIEAYTNDSSAGTIFTYPTQRMNFTINASAYVDYAFPCPTRRRTDDKIMLNYVSDARIVQVPEDTSAEENVVRFICRMQSNVCAILAVAEEPAEIFSSLRYNTEELYLQIKRANESVENDTKDPLCKLPHSEKVRICGSVLNSSYFDGKIEYIPNGQLYIDYCERLKISFHTDEAKAIIGDSIRSYEEWAISCSAEPITDDAEFTYFISRAYNSHMAFVYTRDYSTADMYKIENLSAHIRVIIDDCVAPLHILAKLGIHK